MSDLITQLKQDPFQFGLFQAASLLERIALGQGDTASWGPSDHPVRFKSDITLGFPAGDIQSIRPEDSGSYQVYTSLMCLAGSRGPLPLVFTEMLLASRRNKDHAPVDFMDVFNHRLLHLLFQAKQKYHLSLGARHLADMPLLRFVDASASLGFKEKKAVNEEAIWLQHAALMGAAPRSMSSLLAMLQDRLGIRFEAQQFFGEWLLIDPSEQASLGRGLKNKSAAQLGVNATLGIRAWHQGAGILLQAKNLTPQAYQKLLPGESCHRKLKWLVQQHQSSNYRVCLQIHLKDRYFKPAGLGAQGPRLGLTAWLAHAAPVAENSASVTRSLSPSRFWLADKSTEAKGIKA
ncbi:COG3520 Predicted component of the type VI protein secretion system [Burkholderiaceae bacterium]|jgi:type VI secretion system protein ImpH